MVCHYQLFLEVTTDFWWWREVAFSYCALLKEFLLNCDVQFFLFRQVICKRETKCKGVPFYFCKNLFFFWFSLNKVCFPLEKWGVVQWRDTQSWRNGRRYFRFGDREEQIDVSSLILALQLQWGGGRRWRLESVRASLLPKGGKKRELNAEHGVGFFCVPVWFVLLLVLAFLLLPFSPSSSIGKGLGGDTSTTCAFWLAATRQRCELLVLSLRWRCARVRCRSVTSAAADCQGASILSCLKYTANSR